MLFRSKSASHIAGLFYFLSLVNCNGFKTKVQSLTRVLNVGCTEKCTVFYSIGLSKTTKTNKDQYVLV